MEPYIAPAFGGFVVIALGVLIYELRDIGKTLRDQGEKLVRIATVVGIDGNGLLAKVDQLTEARDAERARLFADMEDEVKLLREERRSGTERRHG
jgi:hypothetical protein